MRIFKLSQAIGTVTLGLASIISSSNAEDKKKIEVPNTPQTVQVKEKAYFNLLNTLDKDLEKNWDSIAHTLYKYILDEPFINDNPPGSRIKKYEGKIVYIEVNKSLTNPFEKILSRILSKPPEENASESSKKRYKEALEMASLFFKGPPRTNNMDCVIAWQEPILEKITKAEPNLIPQLLEDFKDTFETNWERLNPGYDKHREIYNAGSKYFKLILKAGCKNLLDKNSNNNVTGGIIVQRVRNAYSDHGPIDFSKDLDTKRLFLQVLDRMQKEEFKSTDTFVVCLDSTIDFLLLTWNDPDIVRETARSLTAQANFTHKAKNKGLDKKQVEIQEVLLLNTSDKFVSWLWSTFGTRLSNEAIAKNITPLYKSIGENIIKDNSNLPTLNEGRKLVKRLHRFFGNYDKPLDEESKQFVETATESLFKNLLESSEKLLPDERKKFLSDLYTGDMSWFLHMVGKEDITATNKILQIFSKHYFNSKEDKNVEHFSGFVKTVTDVHGFFRWHPVAVSEVLNINKDYLKTVIQESIKNIESNKNDKELADLKDLTQYLESIKDSQDLLREERTSFYPKEKVQEVEALIKDSAQTCSELFLKRLQNEKVIVERSSDNLEHKVYDKGFELTIKSLKVITSINPDHLPGCESVLSKRLDTEADYRTRGELYRATFTIPTKYDVADLRKVIFKEHSPLTMQKIGETVADRFIDELLDGKSRVYILHGYRNYHNQSRYIEIEKLGLDKKMKAFNERLEKVIKKGIIEPNEKTPAQDFILNCVLYSSGRNLRPLFEENLGKKLNLEKEPDPELIKTIYRMISNSNTILSAFGGELYKETKHIALNYHDEENASWTNGLKDLPKVNFEIKKTNSQITKLLEDNLRWAFSVDTFPHITGGLVLLSSQHEKLFDYNQDIDKLSERLFTGADGKLSIFELYELGLQYRYVWDYLENYRKTKGKTIEVEENCISLLKTIEKIRDTKGVDLRSRMQRDLNLELGRLDGKLFRNNVTDSLYNARLYFMKEFITLAPSEQRREYIDIALKRFKLRDYMPESELKKIIEVKH